MEKTKRNSRMNELKTIHQTLTWRGEKSPLTGKLEDHYKKLYAVEDEYNSLHVEALEESISEMQSILKDIQGRHSQRLERRTPTGYRQRDRKITEEIY